MRFHQHASTNTLLTAPMGLEGEVDTIPVTRSDLGGIHTMQSFWRPDEFELAAPQPRQFSYADDPRHIPSTC